MKEKIYAFVKNYWLLILVFIAGFLLRIIQAPERFMYSHDSDLSSFFVRDILVNKHPRLIGQETSTQGIFIGPIYYYLLVPFFLLTDMDPIGGVYLITILGLFSMLSVYYVVSKIWGKKEAMVAFILYSISFYMVFNDREVVPTMPVVTWTVWLTYAIYLIYKGKQRLGFLLTGILAGLIWHLNFALILPLPLTVLALFMSKKKIEARSLMLGILGLVTMSIPLILFELRHGFMQVNALIASLTTHQKDIISGFEKYKRVILLLSKDVHGIFMGDYPGIEYNTVFNLLLLIFLFLFAKKVISKFWSLIIVGWLSIYIVFFSTYSKALSEYYLNGVLFVFIIIISLFISYLLKQKKLKHFGMMIIFAFIAFNLSKFIKNPLNESGYVERKAIIKEIKRDAVEKGFPCVSISYITDPGYDLGYRYFMFLEELKIKPISEKVPVYTIVYPLKKIFPVHTTKGIIGLIYPDYDIYEKDIIEETCKGEDYNVTKPLWGFVN